MLELLDKKIRQMHYALGDLKKSDISQLKYETFSTENGHYYSMDFNQGQTDAQLSNTTSLLIANIASIKDHLKAWCKKHNKTFEGENLINTNMDVGIIHDLWNIDKHAGLNKSPRSGKHPKLKNLRQAVQVKSTPGGTSSLMFSIDPQTGKLEPQTTGNVALLIDAEIVDENENKIGDFSSTCENAATAWEETLIAAGIPIPSRS